MYTDPKDILQNPEIEAVDVLLPVQYNLEVWASQLAEFYAARHDW